MTDFAAWDAIQERSRKAILHSFTEVNCLAAAAPTGYGKTRLGANLIKNMDTKGYKWIWYTHRKTLLAQTIKAFKERGLDFSVRAAGYEEDMDITMPGQVAMIQSEKSAVKKGKREIHNAKFVVIDEAHANKTGFADELIVHHLEAGAKVLLISATPVGLVRAEKIITLAHLSEMRGIGALMLAVAYTVPEQDMALVKKVASGDFSPKYQAIHFTQQQVVGNILHHYRRLQQDHFTLMGGTPCLGFAPCVKSSISMTDQFNEAGVKAAHIDGEDVYLGEHNLDGEPVIYKSDQAMRQFVFDEFEAGRIKVIWNRFVMREGVDLPSIGHIIVATAVGTPETWVQMIGRGLRCHPSLETVCVAEGTPILTDRGYVAIQDVKISDKVWDGIELVSHGGSVYNGNMEVTSWCGLTATPEHKVHTSNGWETIEAAKSGGRRITRTGLRGKEIRVSDNSNPYGQRAGSTFGGGSGVQQVQQHIVCEVPQDGPATSTRLSELHEALWTRLPGMDLSPSAASMETLQRHEGDHIPSLWGAWDRVSFRFSVGCNVLDRIESRVSRRPFIDTRSDQEQRALRAGQFAMGNTQPANEESGTFHSTQVTLATIPGGSPTSSIQAGNCGLDVSSGDDCPADCGSLGLSPVWDILNCGPRNRYTAADVLVGNCIQDHGGNCNRPGLGGPNEDRVWELEDTNKSLVKKAKEDRKKPETDTPKSCPSPTCGRVFMKSKWAANLWKCPACGKVSKKDVVTIIEEDGTLRKFYPKSEVRKPPAPAQKAFGNVYWAAKNSDKDLTFHQVGSIWSRNYPGYELDKETGRARNRQTREVIDLYYCPAQLKHWGLTVKQIDWHDMKWPPKGGE